MYMNIGLLEVKFYPNKRKVALLNAVVRVIVEILYVK